MKKYKTITITGLFLLLFSLSIFAQESTEKIKQSYNLPNLNDSRVHIQNLQGSITVESYNGKMVLVEATKTIKSKTQKGLQKGKSEINISAYEYDKGILIYLDHPCAELHEENLQLNYNCHDRDYNSDYKFIMDITVKVPKGVDFLDVSTVNKGDVIIANLEADLEVNNVNGSIVVSTHMGNIEASTVNGDLSIGFSKNPEKYAEFKTINGDIDVKCLSDLSAKIQYKSMHGDFFTNYDDINFLPSELKQTKKNADQSTKYKLSGIKTMKIGSGQAKFKFNTLNGDMFLTSK